MDVCCRDYINSLQFRLSISWINWDIFLAFHILLLEATSFCVRVIEIHMFLIQENLFFSIYTMVYLQYKWKTLLPRDSQNASQLYVYRKGQSKNIEYLYQQQWSKIIDSFDVENNSNYYISMIIQKNTKIFLEIRDVWYIINNCRPGRFYQWNRKYLNLTSSPSSHSIERYRACWTSGSGLWLPHTVVESFMCWQPFSISNHNAGFEELYIRYRHYYYGKK